MVPQFAEAQSRSKTQLSSRLKTKMTMIQSSKDTPAASVSRTDEPSQEPMKIVNFATATNAQRSDTLLSSVESVTSATTTQRLSRTVIASSKFNHMRMQQFYKIINNMRKAKTFADVIQPILTQLDQVMSCKGAMIVLINLSVADDQDKVALLRNSLMMSESRISGKPIYLIQPQQLMNADLAFNSLPDAKYPVASDKCLSQPLIDQKGRIIGTIQMQAKDQTQKKKGSMELTRGFPMVDQHALQVLATALSLKIDQMLQIRRIKEYKEEMLATIQLAGEICTQRSLPELALNIKKNLPTYMGFESVAIMFRD